jgi:AraC-like DNA-binding protein
MTRFGTPRDHDDPLSDVLQLVRIDDTVYYHAVFLEPWSVRIQSGDPKFHYIQEGECRLDIGAQKDLLVRSGDFLITPHGAPHRLFAGSRTRSIAARSMQAEQLNARYRRVTHGGSGPRCTLICGDLRFDAGARHLLEHLPQLVHIPRSDRQSDARTHSLLEIFETESRNLGAGSVSVITRIADLLVVQALRHWLHSQTSPTASWIRGLSDPQVARALTAIHRHYGRKWTLNSLARHAGVSRSQFAKRFAELVGMTPIDYLTTWRMNKALQIMHGDRRGLDSIAHDLGYSSAAAFSKAFKRVHDKSPLEYRQHAMGSRRARAGTV